MPRKKKQWIDKKRSTTYTLVHTSQDDSQMGDTDAPQHYLSPLSRHGAQPSLSYPGLVPPLASSPSAQLSQLPSQHVGTLPTGVTQPTDGQFDDASQSESESEEAEIGKKERKVEGEERGVSKISASVVGSNLHSRYDYTQHMRSIGTPGGLFIAPDGRVCDSEEISEIIISEKSPTPSVSGGRKYVEQREDEVLDPEILDAIENYDESKFEELPDNFLELANTDDVDNDISMGSYGTMDDIEEDDKPKTTTKPTQQKTSQPKKQVEQKQQQKQTTKYIEEDDDEDDDDDDDDEDDDHVDAFPSGRQHVRTLEDDLFDIAVKKFDKDMEYLYADNDDDDKASIIGKPQFTPQSLFNPTTQSYHPSAFEHVFDEFIEKKNKLSHFQTLHPSDMCPNNERSELPQLEDALLKQLIIEKIEKQTGVDDESEEGGELLEEITLKDKHSQWDCESIVSTYSNLYNHPGVIVEPEKRIKLNKRGFPDIKLKEAEQEEEEVEEEEEEEEKTNIGTARQRNETPEEKKQRKKAVKEERKLKREKKKELKVAYREETTKQQGDVAGKLVNRTILHY